MESCKFLEEKACAFARKIKPVKTSERFSKVSFVDSWQRASGNEDFTGVFQQKKRGLRFVFVGAVVCFLCFASMLMLLLPSSFLSSELTSVAGGLFLPKDFGKIKFVESNTTGELGAEAMASVMEMELPFSVCVAESIDDIFVLESAGEITVKCAMDGVVESITTDENSLKKTVVVNHGSGLRTTYYNLDTVAVIVGDSVQKNTILGITDNYSIGFKVSYKNSIVKGLEIVDDELAFY